MCTMFTVTCIDLAHTHVTIRFLIWRNNYYLFIYFMISELCYHVTSKCGGGYILELIYLALLIKLYNNYETFQWKLLSGAKSSLWIAGILSGMMVAAISICPSRRANWLAVLSCLFFMQIATWYPGYVFNALKRCFKPSFAATWSKVGYSRSDFLTWKRKSLIDRK